MLLSGTGVSWVDPPPNTCSPARLSAIRPPASTCESCEGMSQGTLIVSNSLPFCLLFFSYQTFLFSDHHISCFSPSYQTSASHFPLFVLFCARILLTLISYPHKKATQDKRPMKLWESLSKLLLRLWTHQVSEGNETLYYGAWIVQGWGVAQWTTLTLFQVVYLALSCRSSIPQQLRPLTSFSNFPISPMLFACWVALAGERTCLY